MPRLVLRDVHKRFGASMALRGASLELEAGEVHALLGENGAGKTTLMRVLYGLVRPDRGEIRIDDRPVEIRGPAAALAAGIGLVHQHFMLVPALSVAENLVLGERGPAWLGRETLRARAEELLDRYALELDPDQPAGRLAVGQQQRLEIVRALARGVRVLVLDEPTAVLAPSEVNDLLVLLARLRDEGRTVVFISHKLGEITQVCDRVTVLREGQTVVTRAVAGLGAAELGRLMVGDVPPPPGVPVEAPSDAPVALRLRNLRAPGLRGIDLELRAGELLALAGIDGNGQQPLEEVLAGVRRPTSGTLELLAGPLALLSGDRQRTGLVLDLSVEENLALADAALPTPPSAEPFFRSGWLRADSLRRAVEEALIAFGIRARPGDPVRALSGGNQQKLCVARALRGRSGVLVAVNPTRGLDLQTTAAVRQALRQRARGGAAVLLISSDLDEVLELATRIAVFFRGALAPVEPERRTRERIGERMLGTA